MMKLQRKFVAAIVLIAIVILLVVFARLNHFPVNSEAVRIQEVEIHEDSISFSFLQTDSGYGISDIKWSFSDGTLYVRFYGSLFSFSQLQAPDGFVTLEIGDIAENVEKVEVI